MYCFVGVGIVGFVVVGDDLVVVGEFGELLFEFVEWD